MEGVLGLELDGVAGCDTGRLTGVPGRDEDNGTGVLTPASCRKDAIGNNPRKKCGTIVLLSLNRSILLNDFYPCRKKISNLYSKISNKLLNIFVHVGKFTFKMHPVHPNSHSNSLVSNLSSRSSQMFRSAVTHRHERKRRIHTTSHR